MSVLAELTQAGVSIGGHPIAWIEILGNAFGMASAIGGMRRRVWAWPVGIVGNIALFLLFLGNSPQGVTLLGQVARQVMFAAVAVYGWIRWNSARGSGEAAVTPHFASGRNRVRLVTAWAAGVLVFTPLFRALGSWEPVWADAWIFTGSVIATYAMARGWVEFWLVWIAVDAVGVPTLLRAGYYPSAALYLIYGGFVVWGFIVWLRISRGTAPASVPTPEEVGS